MDELTDREKMVKRLLRKAMFWRSFLFWMSVPMGIAISYLFQSDVARFPDYMVKSVLYMVMAVSSLFIGKSNNSGAQEVYSTGFTALAIVVVVVVVSWVIGRKLLSDARKTVSLTLDRKRAEVITEMVEQGFLYMKKDSDTLAGAAKRKLKQFLLGTGIIAGCVVVAFVILFFIIWITK